MLRGNTRLDDRILKCGVQAESCMTQGEAAIERVAVKRNKMANRTNDC